MEKQPSLRQGNFQNRKDLPQNVHLVVTVPTLPVKHNPYLHDLVWDLLKNEKKGSVLDVPSGPGYFAQTAAQNGFTATAAEIDESLHVLPGVTYVNANMGEK